GGGVLQDPPPATPHQASPSEPVVKKSDSHHRQKARITSSLPGTAGSRQLTTLVNETKWQYYGTLGTGGSLTVIWNPSGLPSSHVHLEVWGYNEKGRRLSFSLPPSPCQDGSLDGDGTVLRRNRPPSGLAWGLSKAPLSTERAGAAETAEGQRRLLGASAGTGGLTQLGNKMPAAGSPAPPCNPELLGCPSIYRSQPFSAIRQIYSVFAARRICSGRAETVATVERFHQSAVPGPGRLEAGGSQ
ncbi:Sushi domain-containing protein 2, partial [Ophiophagus hannah]